MTLRWHQVGDRVSVSDGRPGTGRVVGTIVGEGRIMVPVRVDDGQVVSGANEKRIVYCYEHDMCDPEES